ncbi:hypothetical protein ACFE04_015421 [Oxalis oulophora]
MDHDMIKPKLESLHQNKVDEENRFALEMKAYLKTMSQISDREIELLKDQSYLLQIERDLEMLQRKKAEDLVQKHVLEIENLKEEVSILIQERTITNQAVQEGKRDMEKLKKAEEQCAELVIDKKRLEDEVGVWKLSLAELEERVAKLREEVFSLANYARLNVDDLTTLPDVIELTDSDEGYPSKNTSGGKGVTFETPASNHQCNKTRGGEGTSVMLKRKLGSWEKPIVVESFVDSDTEHDMSMRVTNFKR